MRWIVQIARVIVGLLFIISKLIKLNDPMGFAFKLGDYFDPNVLNLTFLIPYALTLAVIIVIFEVLIGLMLLLGVARRFTLWSLIGMILFFTFLTFYSAYFNKVTDCGCFGDAIPLTPWQSFYKDIVLLVMIIILFIGQKYIKPVLNSLGNASITLVTLVACSFMGYYVLNHLPIMDFRAYKVGTNIQKAMEIPEGAPEAIYDIVFTYKVDGEEKQFKMEELGQLPANAEFVSREQHIIQKGYEPPIHDLTMELEGQDYTPEVQAEPKAF